MHGLRPVPDRAGARARYPLRLCALRHNLAALAPRPAWPWPGAHLRRPRPFHHRLDGDADEGFDRRHRARDLAAFRPHGARATRPVAAGAGRRLHYRPGAGGQVPRHDLRAGRTAPAAPLAVPARRLPLHALDQRLVDARGAAARRVRRLHQARRPGADGYRARRLCARSADARRGVGRYRAGAGRRVGGNRAHRPDPRADAGGAAPRGAAGRRGLRVLRPRQRAGGARAPLPALRRGAACPQARQPQPHLGLRDRRRHPLHSGQLLSRADRHPGGLRRTQHDPGWRRGAAVLPEIPEPGSHSGLSHGPCSRIHY